MTRGAGASAQGRSVRVPPHGKDAEASVLGGILLRNEVLHEVAEALDPEDFYVPAHAAIFAAMLVLERRGVALDPVTIEEQLKSDGKLELAGGIEYLTELATRVPTSENIGHYVRIVREKSQLRQLIRVGSDMVAKAYTEPADVESFFDEAEQGLFKITQSKRDVSYQPIEPIVDEIFERLEQYGERPESGVTGVPTGFSALDRLTSGLQPGDLIVLAARPGLGKTSLGLNIAAHAAIEHNLPVLIFSLEMTSHQLGERLLASEGLMNLSDLRRGRISEPDWIRLTDAASKVGRAPILIDDTPDLNVIQIRNKCRRFRATRRYFQESGGLGLVVVDYLQLMRGTAKAKSESREREIAEISRGLKALAKEIQLPVLALAQLNRLVETRQDKRPRLSDLRESGAIEQDADLIMFIYRPGADKRRGPDEPEDNSAELIVAKHRNGPQGTVHLVFVGQYTKFVEPAEEPQGAAPF